MNPASQQATDNHDIPLSQKPSHANSDGGLTIAVTSTINTTTPIDDPSSPTSQISQISSDEDGEDRINGWRDVVEALKLTWHRQKKHLFVTWIHVPVGVTLLLVITWGLRLAIALAPFRFPAPVIAMLIFFILLLFLDLLSTKFPGQSNRASDAEKGRAQDGHANARLKPKKRRRFVDPVMALLAPPCEFCLRNMSVMFTPSFILIPAREVIPGKEIGLLTAWFLISQVLAFVLPVWFNLGISKACSKIKERKQRRSVKQGDVEDQTRLGRPSSRATPFDSRRGSMATLSGVDFEKGLSFSGGHKLGAIATGLSGVTAHMIAPVTHVNVDLDDDFRRQIESTAMEFARQQGDPAVTCTPRGEHPPGHHHRLAYDSYRPKSDVSSFEHHFHLRPGSYRSSSRRSARSRSRSPSSQPKRRNTSDKGDSSLDAAVLKLRRPKMHPSDESDMDTSADEKQHEHESSTEITRAQDAERPSRSTTVRPVMPSRPEPAAHISAYRFPARMQPALDADDPHTITRLSSDLAHVNTRNDGDPQSHSGQQTAVASRRASVAYVESDLKKKIGFELRPHPSRRGTQGTLVVPANPGQTKNADGSSRSSGNRPAGPSDDEEDEEDAIGRLASWFGDLITPTLYIILFVVGLPLFFVLDIALPLFLAINLLTFIAAITVVPPKVRRFLHPILSTSLATVLIIWAFAAMKGIGLKDCLNRFYSVDAKYTELWQPSGYSGPVPGAGDILFSTLDAGIVALAVPMYRYRKELWENLSRMLVVLFPCAALSLFFWNYIARLMGMDSIRSLAFSARFMSTPLAIELANNVGADESITVILVVITGVVAAILKEQFFYRLMRVDRDDYLTVGLTMGATSGAIGASSLISTPRTMAIASLGFVLFGTILLVCTAIPPIVDIVRSLAGAP